MNWFKTFHFTSKENSSQEIKKGELKEILINAVKESLSDFEFLTLKNNCYSFQRKRQIKHLTVFETIHIIHSYKEKIFTCSIASRLNHNYIYTNSYNSGLINPHIDLKFLLNNSKALNPEDSYYSYNGQMIMLTKTVKEIFKDYTKHGLPFLEKQWQRLHKNEIIIKGIEYIDILAMDKTRLKNTIEHECKNSSGILTRIKNPIFISLKESLQKINGQSKEDRKLIPKTAYEILELYWM